MSRSQNLKKKVFVGLSGGVDSAVSAYLLIQQGYDVEGVFIQTWTPEWMECGWRDDRRDAMRVAIHLGIPFHDLDLSREYKEGVADYMIAEYRAGRTPNPDVMCNREVKFGGFLRYALSCGADYVATGHYARVSGLLPLGKGEIERGIPSLALPLPRGGDLQLMRGVDTSKDQSYFLWTLTDEQLQHVLFPVGGLPKSETRKIAEQARLPVATKKDSQGICFLGAVDMQEFLSHYIEHKTGDVLDSQGKVVGSHDGVWFVTLGQRFAGDIIDPQYRGKPLYVISKDVLQNTVTVATDVISIGHPRIEYAVGPEVEGARDPGQETVMCINQCVWRTVVNPGDRYSVQVRYHGELYDVVIVSTEELGAAATIWFARQSPLAALGQSIVFYDGDICIGGGIVE
jgi:tRNA-specific 2-thiouridylase